MTLLDVLLDLARRLIDLWIVKLAISVITAALLRLFGAWRDAYLGLLILMVLDLLFGLMAAAREKTIDREVGKRKTISKLLGYSVVIIASVQLEVAVRGAHLDWAGDFGVGVAVLYLVSTEALSVLQNYERATGRKLRIAGARGAREAFERLTGGPDDPDRP